MIVKKYTGSTETEAVMKAKEDLGPNAVVLNVKTMKQRGLAKLFKKNFVEITAALEEKEFAQSINSRKPTFEAVAKNTADKPATSSKIDLKADDNVKVPAPSKSTEIIEEKLDNIHKMIRNKMDKEKEETEPVAEETKTQKPSQSSANFKSLKLIYNKLLENEVDEKYANIIINDIKAQN